MKKICLVTSAVLLSLSLYACGQTKSSDEAMSQVQSQVESVSSEAASMMSEAAENAKEQAGEMAEKVDEKMASEVAGLVDEAVFTLDELAKFNGKDGAKAYIAVDGVVYDVTDSKAWKDGMHNGFEAGRDLSEEMRNAPHGLSKLDNVERVGILAE